ncbi:hypothetical protein BKA64DRAFT_248971 [Cadophora sp. MPI-SDFR-AT-0126]|nr:hypothetical protein BKA64DRAFT_248971 [Leotiomycetes sp. MPI-SDFR-AT-0126]
MPSRGTHSKSRHGCTGCKAKRVKCDESKPSCSRCVRGNSECHYKDIILQSAFRSLSPGRSPPSSSCIVPRSSTQAWLNSAPIKESSSSPSPSSSERRFSTQDLELVYHYTLYTSLTLATSKSDEELWQLVVPQEAVSNHFLMYGLLSISSLHIAHLRPSNAECYKDLGAQHYSSAMGLLKPGLQGLGSGNADAVASFIPLSTAISFATLPDPPPLATDYLEVILAKFRSLRAAKDTLQSAWPTLETSPIGLFLFTDTGRRADPTADNTDFALEALEWRIHAEVESKLLRAEYLDAVRYLRHSLQHKVQVLTWPLLVSDHLFQAMTEREPAAIAILGFYGTLLHMLEAVWWVGDKGYRIVSAAAEILPPEWKTLMRRASMHVNLPQ